MSSVQSHPRRLRPRARLVAFLVVVVGVLCSTQQSALGTSSSRSTRISLDGQIVDGSRGTQRLSGDILVSSPATWIRTTRDGASTARLRFTVDESCSGVLQLSSRAVATAEGAKARAQRVTQAPLAVIADRSRSGGWLRVVQLTSAKPGAPRNPNNERVQLYGIAVVSLARSRWVDVRAFGWFQGCSDAQVRTSTATTAMTHLLLRAKVNARLVSP